MQNEVKLWASVLYRAISDLKHNEALIRRSANYWINEDKNDGVGSFIWVCDVLNLDPAKTRNIIFSNNRLYRTQTAGR